MSKIVGNNLLLVIVGLLALYWGAGPFASGQFISSVASLILLVFGLLAFAQYFVPAYQVVVNRRRDDIELGAHYAVLGNFAIATGVIWSGGYGMLWIWSGSPPGWSGTVFSNFGRYLIGAGMYALYVAPQASGVGIQIKPRLWILGAVIVAFITGFVLATQVDVPDEISRVMNINRPACSVDRPIWGSSNRRYHMPDGRYRYMVKPTRCFATEGEAVAAGFTASK